MRPFEFRAMLARLSLLGVALAASFLSGCDNPACVFGGTCAPGGIGGALGTLSASVPENGQILRAAAPTVERFAPMGNAVDPATPIVIVFSEAMSSTNLNIAFQLSQVDLGGMLPLGATTLVGDGRVLVLFPIMSLMPGAQYNVEYRENVTIGDRTGQALPIPANRIAGSFTVAATTPTAPSLVLTFPSNSQTGLPATTEITTVFSRPMDALTVDDLSFVVQAGGVDPEFDPIAQPVTYTLGMVPVTDTRVFRWRALDDAGERASLGTNVDVTVEFSPLGAPMSDTTGVDLPPAMLSFRTLPFSAPIGVTITSFPPDAIGINAISGPADLAVQVDFVDAQVGDEIGVFVFGVQPEVVEVPLTIALFRTATITDPPSSFTFTAEELDLVRNTSPLSARFRDGTLGMAFRVRRGSLESPVRVLDIDPSANGVQGPLLDTVAPTLIGVGGLGTGMGTMVSDARDVVLVGRASEELRAAFVSTMLGDNEVKPGEPPHVVGSDAGTGFFIAAPIRVGILQDGEQPLNYQLTLYDRALNVSGTSMGTYTQRGAAAAGFPRPFLSVNVEVFDAHTLAPVAGADVYSHEDVDGSIFQAGSAVTGPDGRATVDPALIGRTLVTVRRAGYDLFTFDGVPTDTVSIPLQPSAPGGATVGGVVATLDPLIQSYTRTLGDTRFPRPGETLAAVGSCAFDGIDQRLECSFGPAQIRSRDLGGVTAMAVLPPASALSWSAQIFLRSFGLRVPLPEQAPGTLQTIAVVMDRLDVPGTDEELLAIDVPAHGLLTAAWPMLPTAPRIRVEGLVPGLRGPLTVGQGLAFSAGLPPSTYGVRAAYPGIADPISDDGREAVGSLVANGTIEPDLFLRAEAVAANGSRGVDRPRLSTTDMTLSPPAAQTFGPAPIGLNITGEAFDVRFSDTLTDVEGQPGIHRLSLLDSAGRRWTVWRLDAPDVAGPDVVVHLPLTMVGEPFPLAAGQLTATASSWSWPDFDTTSFLWTDVDREFERAAFSAPTTIDSP